jgi:hypothetical protein
MNGYHGDMSEDKGMGTTGTPDQSGAAAIDEPDSANASHQGIATTSGGELDDPALPYDHRPQSDDPVVRRPD